MLNEALQNLERIVEGRRLKQPRIPLLDQMVARPERDGTPDWAFNVPRHFNDALDIRWTQKVSDKIASWVWTQGSSFAFKAWDVIHTNGQKKRVSADGQLGIFIQINSALPAGANDADSEFPGSVKFTLFDEINGRMNEVTKVSTTQDNFIRFLITGNADYLPTQN